MAMEHNVLIKRYIRRTKRFTYIVKKYFVLSSIYSFGSFVFYYSKQNESFFSESVKPKKMF